MDRPVEMLSKQLWLILQRTITSVRKEPTIIVTVLRIIEREERFLLLVALKHGFNISFYCIIVQYEKLHLLLLIRYSLKSIFIFLFLSTLVDSNETWFYYITFV